MFDQKLPRAGWQRCHRTGHSVVTTATILCHHLAPLEHSQRGAGDSSSCWKELTAREYWLFQNIIMFCSFFFFFQTAWFSPNCLPSIHSSTIPSPQETDKTGCISIYMKALGNSIMFLLFYCRWHTNFSLLLQKAPEPCGVQ